MDNLNLIRLMRGCGLIVLAGIIFLWAGQIQAQTDSTWTGGGDGTSWFDVNNWSNGIPDGLFNAFIDNDTATDSILNTGNGASILLDSLNLDAGDTLNIGNSSGFTIVTDSARPSSGVINNDGTINLTNAFNITDLVIGGDVSLNGTGRLVLGGSSGVASRLIDEAGTGGHLTNNGNTIEGAGQIGVDTLQITNTASGTIDANVSGQTLAINPNAAGLTNAGTLRSSSGGNLSLLDGQVDNTGGTILAGDGSTVTINDAAEISGGILESTGTGSIIAGTSTLANLSNRATINQNNSSDLAIDGNIVNEGDINVTNAFNLTDLVVDGATELSGGGNVTLAGSSGTASRILDSTGVDGELTNVDNVIQGSGQIGVDSVRIVNQAAGVIQANEADRTLVLDPSTGDLVNSGTLLATGQGELSLTGNGGGQFLNSGGTILAENDSVVELTGGATVVGGNLQTNGTGEIQVSGAATVEDVTVDGQLTVLNGTSLDVAGTIDNRGNIGVTNSFNFTDLVIESDATLTGGGQVTLGGSSDLASRIQGTAQGVLTNVDNTIQGVGAIGVDRLQVINETGGTIVANDSAGSLTLDPGAAPLINQGALLATSGGELVLTTGTVDNTGGLIEAQTDSTVVLSRGVSVSNGLLNSDGTGVIEVSQDATLNNVSNAATINLINGSALVLEGTVDNIGTLNANNAFNNTDVVVDGTTTLTGTGEIVLRGLSATASRVLDQSGADGVLNNAGNVIRGVGQLGLGDLQVNNQAGGTILADVAGQTLTFDSRSPNANQGVFASIDGATLAVNHALTNEGVLSAGLDSTIDISSTLTNSTIGLITGDGVIEATNIVSDGTIAAGIDGIGSLTFSSDTQLGSDNLFAVEVAAGVADFLSVGGLLDLDGDLELSLLSGFLPSTTDEFTIATAFSPITGSFSNVANGGTLLTSDGLGSFTVNFGVDSSFGAESIVLSNFNATGVPEPGTIGVLALIGGAMIVRRRRS